MEERGDTVVDSATLLQPSPGLERRTPSLLREAAPAPLPLPRADELADLRARVEQLSEALASNRTIGAAVGVVLERHQLDRASALAHLVRLSQNSNTKLVEVAEQLLQATERAAAGRGGTPSDPRG